MLQMVFQAPYGYFQSKTSSFHNLSYHPSIPAFMSLAEQLSADRELGGQYQKINSKHPFWNGPYKNLWWGRKNSHSYKTEDKVSAQKKMQAVKKICFFLPWGSQTTFPKPHVLWQMEKLLCKGNKNNEQAAIVALLVKLGLFPGSASGISQLLLLSICGNNRFSSCFFLRFFFLASCQAVIWVEQTVCPFPHTKRCRNTCYFWPGMCFLIFCMSIF